MVKKYQANLQEDLQPVRALHQQMLTAMETISTSEMKLETSIEAKMEAIKSVFDNLAKILAEEKQFITESVMESFKGQKKLNSAKKDEISTIMDELESVIRCTESDEPNQKFLESVATRKKEIDAVLKVASNMAPLPTELPQREAKLLSPARFKEICSSNNFTYTERDLFKGQCDPQNLLINEPCTLHIDLQNSGAQ